MTATTRAMESGEQRGRTLADRVIPVGAYERSVAVARDLALVVAGAAIIALTANLSVPIPGSPVPVTGQTFSVLLVSGAVGLRRGIGATGLYLVAGLLLPVYAEHRSGLGVFGTVDAAGLRLGATGGYLVGFLLASAVVGRLAERGWDREVRSALAAMAIGNVLIYAIGLPWLALATGFSVPETIAKGLVPFLVGDLVKLGLAGVLLPAAWWLLDGRPSGGYDR